VMAFLVMSEQLLSFLLPSVLYAVGLAAGRASSL